MMDLIERLNQINLELDQLEEEENWAKIVKAKLEREKLEIIEELSV